MSSSRNVTPSQVHNGCCASLNLLTTQHVASIQMSRSGCCMHPLVTIAFVAAYVIVYIRDTINKQTRRDPVSDATHHHDLSISHLTHTMAATKKAFPRATLRKILKAHTNKNISRDVDTLVYLDFVLFVQSLMTASVKRAKKAGEKRLAAKDIRMLTMKSLRAFKG